MEKGRIGENERQRGGGEGVRRVRIGGEGEMERNKR